MIALLFLALSFLAGWLVWRRLAGDPAELTGALGLAAPAATLLAPWLTAAAALTLGLLIVTVAVFILASLANAFLPAAVYPLLPANLAFFLAVPLLAWLDIRSRRNPQPGTRNESLSTQGRLPDPQGRPLNPQGWPPARPALRKFLRSFLSAQWPFLLALLAFAAFAAWLDISSFSRSGSTVSAGSSVFSDFSTHTALVSSFAKGRNFPVGYPHFASDGIAYHFLFFFLCGNLLYLGLPIDLAINLPSILTFVAFCVLLGLLAVAITRLRAAFFLAPYLMVFRSSFAFLTRLRDLLQQPGATLSSVLKAVLETRTFIGGTPRDSWGLWGLNVYANQRHLAFGISALLAVLFLFLPFLLPPGRHLAASDPRRLRPDSPADRRRLAAALIVAALLPYFHGSALIALLLVLAGLMPFSRARLAHVCVAAVAVASAFLQGRQFRSGGLPLAPQLYFGFIAENRTPIGILAYLYEMSGLLLLLAVLAALLLPRTRRLLPAFLLPLAFGLTVSLTPDVTVNHKYLMITFGLLGCLVTGLLGWLWRRPGRLRAGRRVLAVILLLVLSLTGWMELVIFRNLNEIRVSAVLDSPLVAFVEKSTPPQSVFVTGPLSYHALFFTGRQVYFGHAYYAWSAGHDTFAREAKVKAFLAAVDGDPAAAARFIAAEKVDYLMIDNELRQHPEYTVNEAFFRQNFREVAWFPGQGDLRIFDLHQPAGALG